MLALRRLSPEKFSTNRLITNPKRGNAKQATLRNIKINMKI